MKTIETKYIGNDLDTVSSYIKAFNGYWAYVVSEDTIEVTLDDRDFSKHQFRIKPTISDDLKIDDRVWITLTNDTEVFEIELEKDFKNRLINFMRESNNQIRD